jgi:hypothetical protein
MRPTKISSRPCGIRRYRATIGSRAACRLNSTLGHMTGNLRDAMDATLKALVFPALRGIGFNGSFPHFRRATNDVVELLTFQFDRSGGGFVIEIARCATSGYTTTWGKHIPPSKVRAWDLHPDQRHRIQPRIGGGTDAWFRFDNGNVKHAANEVIDAMPKAEAWWQSLAQQCAPAAGLRPPLS